MVACDVLESIFKHLETPSLSTARSVCSHWANIGEQDSVIATAVANSKLKLTRTEIIRKLGLTYTEACSLPGAVPYITRRGYTCWLYGPESIILGLKLVKVSGGQRRMLKGLEKQRLAFPKK